MLLAIALPLLFLGGPLGLRRSSSQGARISREVRARHSHNDTAPREPWPRVAHDQAAAAGDPLAQRERSLAELAGEAAVERAAAKLGAVDDAAAVPSSGEHIIEHAGVEHAAVSPSSGVHLAEHAAIEQAAALSPSSGEHLVNLSAVEHANASLSSGGAAAAPPPGSLCAEEAAGEGRVGCTTGCICHWYERCYPKHVQERNLGVCDWGLVAMMVAGALLFASMILLVLLCRFCFIILDDEACKQFLGPKDMVKPPHLTMPTAAPRT